MAKSLIKRSSGVEFKPEPITDEEFSDFGGPTEFTLDKSRGIKPGVSNKSLVSANSQGVTADPHIPGELEDELSGVNADRDMPKDFSDYGGPKGLATVPDASMAATDADRAITSSPLSPKEVIGNVIGYLHENGLGDLGHAVFNMALPKLKAAAQVGEALNPVGAIATGMSIGDKGLSDNDTLDNRPDLKYGALHDQDSSAFADPDVSDANATADRATSSLEAPTFNVGHSGGTSASSNASASVVPLKTGSSDSPMSDEEIHQWNLKNNPNYDPRTFDIASNSFNYNH